MTQANIETAPKKGETSEQFKARIEETRRELAREEATRQNPHANAAPGSPTPAATPEQVNTSGSVANPSAEPPAQGATRGVVPEVDDWWAKKGFKTPEDIANSYRELERELTRKNQEAAARNVPPPAPPPVTPGFDPWAGLPQQAPAWQPRGIQPSAPLAMPPPHVIEQLAKQYGLTPEDFEKVYMVANDLSKVNVRAELDRVLPGLANQVRAMNADLTRQREMVDLMSEPTWKNPQVQFEMHKVLQDDPAIIQRQPLPYRYAHDEALKRIAKANLGGSNSFQGAPTGNAPASPGNRPPSVAGGNGKAPEVPVSGQGRQEIDADQFAALSLDDKRKFLQGLGAIGR